MKGMSEDKGWIKYVLDYTRSWYSRMRSNCRLISREKPGRKFVPGKKYFSWRIILEQILHLCMSGEKFYHRRFGKKFSPRPSPQKSNGLLLTGFTTSPLASPRAVFARLSSIRFPHHLHYLWAWNWLDLRVASPGWMFCYLSATDVMIMINCKLWRVSSLAG